MTPATACLTLLALLLAAGKAAATVPPPRIIGVRVGFAGLYRVGVWTPVEVSHDYGERVSVTVPDGEGVLSRFTNPNVSGGSALVYARFGRVDSRMTVELSDGYDSDCQEFATDGSIPGRQYPAAIAATRQMILNVSAGPLAIKNTVEVDSAAELPQQDDDRRTLVVRLADCRQLPDRWYGYEGVDAVVLSSSRPEIFAGLNPNSPQIVALQRWVRMGGRLVVCVGSQGGDVLAKGAPLSGFAPGEFRGMHELYQTRSLEVYAASPVAIPRPSDAGPVLRVPKLTGVAGEVRARELDLPLVVCTPRGLGQIVFIAAELDRPPLQQWTGRSALIDKLLEVPAARVEESGRRSAVMHHGYVDLSGQLRSALDQFSDVSRVPFYVVATLIVVYLVLIGPVDYFLLRKLTRRMQWTWVTFPGIVLAVSLVAYCLAYGLKGDRVRVNQVDLIDVDAATGFVRGTSWANVFSPQTRPFHLSLRPSLPGGLRGDGLSAEGLDSAEDPQVLFSWHGSPGKALGAMDPRTSNLVPWLERYDFSPRLDAMQGVPVQIWSTRSFAARFYGNSDVRLEAELSDDGLSLSGRITSRLGFPLSRCILAYDRYAYELGTLESGVDSPSRIDGSVKRSELKTVLTERKLKLGGEKGDSYLEATEYRRFSVEIPYILRAMMFYRAAGGRRYTGLSNGYQSFVDLSSLLDTDRAILVGLAPDGRRGAEMLDDGRPMNDMEDRHVTIYRFVFPVKRPSRP